MISLKIRSVKETGSTPLAGLAGQMGYPSTPKEIASRLAWIFKDPDQAVLDAEADGQIGGGVHFFPARPWNWIFTTKWAAWWQTVVSADKG